MFYHDGGKLQFEVKVENENKLIENNFIMHTLSQRLFKILYGFLILFACMSCDNDDDDGNTGPDVTAQDREFAVAASYSNLAEVSMGELAQSKAVSDEVVDFGEMMDTEHTMAWNELREIADDLDIVIPDTVKAEDRQKAEALSAMDGAMFDSAYIAGQIMAHEKAQELFEGEINDGNHPDLKAYASSTLEHINAHLERAIEIRAENGWDM